MKKLLIVISLLCIVMICQTAQAQTPPPPVHPSVSLSWVGSTDCVNQPTCGYNVYRSQVGLLGCPVTVPGGATWTKIASNIGSVVYTDLAVKIDAYCYYVTAALNSAESGPSNLSLAVLPLAGATGLSAKGN